MRILRLICILAAAVSVASCTRVQTATQGGRHTWTQPHTLRIADTAEPDHFNPLLSTMDLVYDLDSMVFSFLVIADDKGQLIGDLATEVPSLRNGGISKDGRTYTYHLHHGVMWHDGVKMTSRDVKFTAQAVVNPNNNTLHREGFDRIASMDTPDDDTIVVHLKERYPPFLTKFFAPLQEGGKGVLPEHLLGKLHDINQIPFNAHPIGTGPFKFQSWDRGRRIVLVRNDAYFKGRPKLERIIYNFVPDDNVILTQVRTHDIDLVTSPPPTLYDQYKALPDAAVYLVPWNAQNIFIIDGQHPPLGDVHVKTAIAMAIDYESIIQKITHGVGTIAHDIVPPVALGYTENPPYHYDPKAANALLEANGWKMGADGVRSKGSQRLDFVMHISVGSAAERQIAAFLQPEFKAIGLNMEIKQYPYSVIFSHEGPIYQYKYDFADYSYTQPYDPDNLFYVGCKYWFPKGENLYGYCDPAVDAGEKAGVQTDDPAKRAEIYHGTEKRIHDTIPWIPLYTIRRVVVRSPDLQNFSTNPSSTPWWNIWQWDI
ncbi:MAG: peptide ABC transporter substrate-binding protein [Candidatus Eremiobacteraeota bacterium]|nr:peptide ABC transporter substrate-binding protein [Candidatus Eremiobacteraeota bacterium]